ncbi:MAG TPA: DUF302 domain-containing protein [Fimbriimonas sp.]
MQTTGESYGIGRSLDIPFEQAVAKVKEAFKEEGFGSLSEIDIQGALREKIGKEIEPYTVLGMCNPKLAHRSIQLEPEIGTLLPCNVLVRQEGGRIHVTAQNPSLFVQLTDNPAVEPIAREARERIDRALARLG